MKGFKLTDTGDISITDGHIDLVENINLERQTIETVLRTNKGESPFNSDEGIDFRQILGKGITEDMIRTQIQSGVHQVNSDRTIEDFDMSIKDRKLNVNFTARDSTGSAIALSGKWN